MKRGKRQKLKQKKEVFKAKHGYIPIYKKSNTRHKKSKNRVANRRWNHFKCRFTQSDGIKRIKNEDILFDFAKNHPEGKTAVENPNLKDENKLLELINGDYGFEVRTAAVKRINNPDILMDLISDNFDWHVRCEAINMLETCDDSIFIRAALDDDDYMVRRQAVKRLKNQDVLIFLSRNDDDLFVRCEALAKIKNMDVIVHAAKNDESWRVRKVAIELIEEGDDLAEILKYENDPFIRDLIEKRIA